MNKFNNLVDIERESLQKFVDNTSCYDAKHWGNRYGTLAQTFSFGVLVECAVFDEFLLEK